MNARQIMENPTLRPFVRHVPQGSYLFRQGDPAKTMFLILRGRVRLIGEGRDGDVHVSNRLKEGEMLGERVIASTETYPRSLTAFAETDVTVLEFSLRDFQHVQAKEPMIANLMFKNIVQLLLKRWDQTNRLVRLLRSSDNRVRALQCITFFADCFGKPTPGGVELIVDPQTVHHYIDMPIDEINHVIQELVDGKFLAKIGMNCYLIRDLAALHQATDHLLAA